MQAQLLDRESSSHLEHCSLEPEFKWEYETLCIIINSKFPVISILDVETPDEMNILPFWNDFQHLSNRTDA